MSKVATILNLVGLTAGTVGAAVMLSFEIRERNARSKKTQELARLKNAIAAREDVFRDVVRLTTVANRALNPVRDRYSVEEATKHVREQIDELRKALDKLEDINQEVLDNLLPLTHPMAYALLMLGFFCQALALAL